jgi:DNA-binding beta-propeller fold protein YncE
MKQPKKTALLLLIPIISIGSSGISFAYRPFDSTDAAVADVGQLEVELGPVGFRRSDVERTVVAPAYGLNLGFVKNWELVLEGRGEHARLTIFNTKTLETIGEVKSTGENPGPTVFDPATKRVFTFNLNSNNATVLDSKEGKVVGAFDLGGKPELVGTDAKGSVFVNLVQKNVVLQIDAQKMTVAHTWPIAPGVGPRTMAVDQRNGRLFIGCANRRMVIMDSNNGRVIGSAAIGAGPDDSAYDPETRLVYTSNGDGTVSVIQQDSPDDYRVLETVKTAPGARNMALDLKTKKIFLPLSDREAPPPGTQMRGKVIPGSFRVLVFGM